MRLPKGWYRQPEFEGKDWTRVWVHGSGDFALCRAPLEVGQMWWQLRQYREGKQWWPLLNEARSLKELIAAWVSDRLLA